VVKIATVVTVGAYCRCKKCKQNYLGKCVHYVVRSLACYVKNECEWKSYGLFTTIYFHRMLFYDVVLRCCRFDDVVVLTILCLRCCVCDVVFAMLCLRCCVCDVVFAILCLRCCVCDVVFAMFGR